MSNKWPWANDRISVTELVYGKKRAIFTREMDKWGRPHLEPVDPGKDDEIFDPLTEKQLQEEKSKWTKEQSTSYWLRESDKSKK